VDFVMCGVTNEDPILTLVRSLGRVRILPVQPNYRLFFEFMSRSQNWDIGLAPLQTGTFEDCKSDIKLTEYSLFNTAFIASAVPAYRHVTGLNFGKSCLNNYDLWRDAIIELASSSDQRKSYVEKAREFTLSHRLLDAGTYRWIDCIEKLMDTHSFSGVD